MRIVQMFWHEMPNTGDAIIIANPVRQKIFRIRRFAMENCLRTLEQCACAMYGNARFLQSLVTCNHYNVFAHAYGTMRLACANNIRTNEAGFPLSCNKCFTKEHMRYLKIWKLEWVIIRT